jgi:hypothetical protein
LASADAQPVVLTDAEANEIDIRVQRSGTYTITGTVIDSTGSIPERHAVSIVRIEANSMSSTRIETRPGGGFIARGLIPGEYGIRAEILGEPEVREMGYVPIRIDNSDVENIVVAMAKAIRVSGSVVFEDVTPPRDANRIMIRLATDRTSGERFGYGAPASATVKEDWTFELAGVVGPQALAVSNLPAKWIVRQIRFRGKDITDLTTDLTGANDPSALQIILTTKGAEVTGHVVDEKGNLLSDGRVYMFNADRERRRDLSATMTVSAAIRDGTFTIGPARPGEYLIAALASEDMPVIFGGTLLDRVTSSAQRITLRENDRRTIELRAWTPK